MILIRCVKKNMHYQNTTAPMQSDLPCFSYNKILCVADSTTMPPTTELITSPMETTIEMTTRVESTRAETTQPPSTMPTSDEH
jgi:hypothetical protein